MTVIQNFWRLNKNSKLQGNEHKVRTHEEMSELAKEAIANNEIKAEDKYYNYLVSFAKGETITNKFGRKLYFKRYNGEE